MARASGFGAPSEGYELNWNGRKLVDYVDNAALSAMQRVRDQAQRYWRDEEWNESAHPEMTGDERDQGYFVVEPNGAGTTRLTIGSASGHAIFEELGTSRRAGHMPLRKTLDIIAPAVAPALRRAFKTGR